MTIKKQFLIVIILLTTIPFIIMPWLGYFYIQGIMEEQLILQSEQNLEQTTRDMEKVLDDLIGASNAITLDMDIVSLLKKNFLGGTQITDIKKVTEKISNVNAAHLYRYNAEISIYDKEASIYTTTTLIPEYTRKPYSKEWIEKTLQAGGHFVWTQFVSENKKDKNSKPVIGMARNILDISGKTIGVLAIELYEDRNLANILFGENEFVNTERYLVDDEGNIILQYINNAVHQQFYNKEWFQQFIKTEGKGADKIVNAIGERQLVSGNMLNKANWHLIQIIPYNDLLRKLEFYRNFTIGGNLVFLFIIIGLDILIINKITRSIIKLRDAMQSVKKGEFITITIPKTNQEVQDLSKDFNIMSSKLQQLFEENKRIYEEKQRTRLEALQTQIQPHFLFNTLNGIKWLCVMEGAKTAEKMLISLGFILEYSLSKNRDVITLKEEVVGLEHYIALQKMRYGETFEVSYEVDEEVENMEVPILFLQPLVENAIIHGFCDLEEKGHIDIKAKRERSKVHIIIADNGCGVDEEQMINLLASQKKSSSIGVKNVQERIKIYYGKESSFSISNNERGGTTVEISWLVKGGSENEADYS
ncbi:hypothetical protein CS063_04580 [Sporanaerobium hydrogeniformans]|uniref:Uncharacterized protein n=1 Tax=Sporanaerobium hydrogeniformans TaxID=3072179 RepID=A0AC61DF63_9FIRM|nr:sensor histidine kinase [Sporanaerobium hydrogeniformans]PHV71836.1 hypothetical protein CS063_04580 [Sporanaerobium hydrogeniformans]